MTRVGLVAGEWGGGWDKAYQTGHGVGICHRVQGWNAVQGKADYSQYCPEEQRQCWAEVAGKVDPWEGREDSWTPWTWSWVSARAGLKPLLFFWLVQWCAGQRKQCNVAGTKGACSAARARHQLGQSRAGKGGSLPFSLHVAKRQNNSRNLSCQQKSKRLFWKAPAKVVGTCFSSHWLSKLCSH